MRYGPYSVIGMQSTSMMGEQGALWNYPDTSVPKPEDSDFTIFGMQAGLEYPNGTEANINSGMWLHHMVHITQGPGRSDPTCLGHKSLPHFDVGGSPDSSERSFSSGNERTALQLSGGAGHVDAGYHVTSADTFALIIDLMNMNMDDRTVYLTMDVRLHSRFPSWLGRRQAGLVRRRRVRHIRDQGATAVRRLRHLVQALDAQLRGPSHRHGRPCA